MSRPQLRTYAAQEEVFIARQPIFGRDLRVYGYELLFRAGSGNEFDGTDADAATSQVIATTFLTIGAEKLLNGKLAFINFGENMFRPRMGDLLPSRSVVIEILENVQPTDTVLAACQELRRRGYMLALDDVGEHSDVEPWLGVVGILKVDFRNTGVEERRVLARWHRKGDIRLLAEKLESREEFEQAVSLGYDYFQGFLFGRPEMLSGRRFRILALAR